jgi:hypothetical protein
MPITDDLLPKIAIWAAVAFIVWLLFISIVSRLGVPTPVVVAAVLSWVVAGLIIWGAPNVSHWIEHLFVT